MTKNNEKMVQANGVDLCVQTFGNPDDPAILLIHGACASMLWWEEELCERIATNSRYVIRFDNRDTGRSVSYPTGQPGYSLKDMVGDAVGILDVLGINRAHFVGRSMAGATITQAALNHAGRVASLTFVSTTLGGADLSPMSQEFTEYTSSGKPDPADSTAVVEFLVGLMRVYSGGSPYFDEGAMLALAERDVARTKNIASCLTNHFVIDLGDEPIRDRLNEIKVPTLVVHGKQDPVFPLDHGQALQKAIPGAELLIMEKAGHELPRTVWDVVVRAILQHTSTS